MAVHLGFLSPVEPQELRADIDDFPSKTGGKPIWLNPHPLTADDVICGVCGKPQILLLQIYTPEENPEAYHRVIYIFCCRNGKCHKVDWRKCMSVFRSQLPKENPYYCRKADSEDTMEIDGPNPLPSIPQTCVVCGLAGPKSCGACKAVQYCSKDHQTLHWTKGRHKLVCGNLTTSADDIRKDEQALRQLLFPEHELVSEDEPGPEALKDDAFVQALSDTVGLGQLVENDETFPDEEVAEDSEVDVDRTFLKFQKRLSREPEQVLRYARVSYSSEEANPQPLWANDGDRPDPEADIGCCPQCNAQRTFELQVMPQLLNSLDIVHSDPDAMDWGTLLVYSCNANCTPAQGFYQREVIWRQMFADQGMNLRLPPEAMETK